jgi:hypothetical protein
MMLSATYVLIILLSVAYFYISPALVLKLDPNRANAQFDSNVGSSFEVNLSNNTGTSSYPQLAVSGINVYVIWEDTSSASGSFDIFFKRSTDNGKAFGDIINLSNNTGNSINPQLAVSGSNISVVWEDEITNNPFNNTYNNNDNSGILYAASTDNGKTFGDIINLSNNNNSADNKTAVNPQLAVSGSNISVAWEEYSQGQNGDVIFKRSTDNGQTFGDIINLSNNTGNSINPQLAVSGNNIYAVWSDNSAGDYDIFLSRSADGGGNFSKRTNLSIVVGNSLTPTIAVSGDNVFVAWRDFIIGSQARAEILYTKSNDNGNTFDKIINLSNSTGPSLYPQLIAFGNNVYLIWEDATPGNSEIFFVRSADNGDTFDRKINLSDSRGNSVFAHMAVYGDNVYVVWSDDDDDDYERHGEGQVFNATTMHGNMQEENSDIFFSKSNNEGATFSDVKKLSDGKGESVFPSIVASRSNVFIVWSKHDISGNTAAPGNSEIVFTRRI